MNIETLKEEKREIVAIDGKTICGSGNAEHSAYHVVSAFVVENEITAVPELLDLIDIEGTIVTADAMSCQKKIVSKIIEKKRIILLLSKKINLRFCTILLTDLKHLRKKHQIL